MKILHCPTTIGGNPQSLSKAERELGYDSKSMTLMQNYMNYSADYVVFSGSKYSPFNFLRRIKAIIFSLRNHDVLHYNFGRSIAPARIFHRRSSMPYFIIWLYNNLYARWFECMDVAIAKKLGKIIAVTYQGSDARQGWYCTKNCQTHYCHEEGGNKYFTKTGDKIISEQIAKFDKYADLIYSVNPDLLNVLPKRARFMPYANIDPKDWEPCYLPEGDNDIPHIVHAPTDRTIKGTKYILDAFERLKNDGIEFRYTLVENMSHEQAMEVYKSADILIDQLLIGYYGGLAVELMCLGKPVICYLRDEDIKYLPEQMQKDLPIINANPDDIYDVLKECLTTKKSSLRDIGIKGRKYAETWHDPKKIAAGLIDDYKKVYRLKNPH